MARQPVASRGNVRAGLIALPEVAATPSIRIVKTIPWQGGTKTISNRYHFNGGTPASDSAWHTLMDNVTAAEKLIYVSTQHIVEAIGYAAGSDVPVSTKTYSLPGTFSTPTAGAQMGEVCALARWPTTARTSKNHPIYLFNYWHGVYVDTSGDNELLLAAQKTLMTTYANAWVTGFSDGTLTLVRAGPNGATGLTATVGTYVTVHEFPR